LITKMPREWAEPVLQRMLGSIRHESFYTTGTWTDEALGVYVGWTALKDSFAETMPVRNERGNAVLVFSGEDFPEPGIVRWLKDRGHEVEPNEASYLVHLYEEDPAFPAGLNGRFQGLLVDRAQGTAVLFNDRFGMRQVYYHESKEAFYFAAEAKAILAALPELRAVDSQGLGEFVACGCVMENRTLFKGIELLPAAAAWSFRNASLERKSTYFKAEDWEKQDPLDAESFYAQLRTAFTQNLPRYFGGKQRMGMSLTGGLDTRMIMAWQRSPAGSLPCYTFGGTYRDCRDVVVARQVARTCEQSHQVITLGEDFLLRFPYYAERSVYLTDCTVDMSRTPALYANEKAREIAPVRIAGIYGSEVIRWLPGFRPTEPTPGLFRPELLAEVELAKKTYKNLCQGHPVSFVLFHQAPQRGVNTLEESQLTIRTPYVDNDFVRAAFRAPAPTFARSDIFSKKDVSLRLIAEGSAALRRIRTDRGLAGAGGLSAKLARAYLEFTFKAEYAYDYGMPQVVAQIDHAFAPLHLERLFLGRHKFYHFRVWYRDALSDYVREMLLDPRTLSRPYLHRHSVETMVEGHIRGNRNYTTEIHKLLTLELLHRLFIDS
jgi:asparagine synthase (glutamine-hydrolysing)